MTIAIQIGNTDNKLTQQEWSSFCSEVHKSLGNLSATHFKGGPPTWEPWQNMAIIAEIPGDDYFCDVKLRLTEIRKRYHQDSIAITTGATEFI